MTATGHALVGALIATRVSNPLLAIPLAIASHILADLMPHWDAGTHRKKKTRRRLFWEALSDVLIGFILVFLFIIFFAKNTNPFYILAIVLVSQGLDWVTAPYFFLHMKYPPFSWAYRLQTKINHPLDKPWGIITQIAFVLLVFLLTLLPF